MAILEDRWEEPAAPVLFFRPRLCRQRKGFPAREGEARLLSPVDLCLPVPVRIRPSQLNIQNLGPNRRKIILRTSLKIICSTLTGNLFNPRTCMFFTLCRIRTLEVPSLHTKEACPRFSWASLQTENLSAHRRSG
ncbi:hypothetical protein PAV_14c00230 [Paenibacillus alvei DSM 29]|nr:hypothetical protein PAV_14c00230 [Paenibacillus alvei DSM 29]